MATPSWRVYDVLLTIQGGPLVAVHAIDHIQAAIAAAITGTATLGTNVEQDRPEGRAYPKGSSAVANVFVETDELDARATDGQGEPLEYRKATAKVVIRSKKAAGAGYVLRTAMSEVVTAILADKSLGIGCADTYNNATLVELEGDHSEKDVAKATMDWIVEYEIRADQPATILPS